MQLMTQGASNYQPSAQEAAVQLLSVQPSQSCVQTVHVRHGRRNTRVATAVAAAYIPGATSNGQITEQWSQDPTFAAQMGMWLKEIAAMQQIYGD
jgi:hypothetical protein